MMAELEPGERMCPVTSRATLCREDCLEDPNCRFLAHNAPRIIAFPGNFNRPPEIVMRAATLEEVEGLKIPSWNSEEIEFEPIQGLTDDKFQEALRELQEQLPDIETAAQQMIAVGVGTPEAVIVAEAEGEIARGDPVEIGPDGVVRRADGGHVVGVALGGNRIRFATSSDVMSWTGRLGDYGSHMMHASIAYQARRMWDPIRDRPARYQYNERFPKEVEDKAMKLLEKFMNPEQYSAFLKGHKIELQNKAENHRLLINRAGDFSILKGPRGAGITVTSGRCRSYKYPLGDEIAAFLDWFKHRTEELIDRWKCGTFGIIEGGKER